MAPALRLCGAVTIFAYGTIAGLATYVCAGIASRHWLSMRTQEPQKSFPFCPITAPKNSASPHMHSSRRWKTETKPQPRFCIVHPRDGRRWSAYGYGGPPRASPCVHASAASASVLRSTPIGTHSTERMPRLKILFFFPFFRAALFALWLSRTRISPVNSATMSSADEDYVLPPKFYDVAWDALPKKEEIGGLLFSQAPKLHEWVVKLHFKQGGSFRARTWVYIPLHEAHTCTCVNRHRARRGNRVLHQCTRC